MGRDHPIWLRERFVASIIVCLISIFLSFNYIQGDNYDEFLAVLGIRSPGLLPALIHSLALTAVLYFGSFFQHIAESWLLTDGNVHFFESSLATIRLWPTYLSNYIWWRNHFVAPLTEEIVYVFINFLYFGLSILR
jgi:hypothetical protein